MKFALFLGCKIPYFVPHYELSTRAVCEVLGVELVDVEFNCCGYPVRHLHFESFLLSAVRNLALAEGQGLDIVTPCKCCYGTLKKAEHLVRENDFLRSEVNAALSEEGLSYGGGVGVRHLLSVFYEEVGLEAIRQRVVRPYRDLNIATHYGCHALRPGALTGFDDPVNPVKFDRLVEATGARSVSWGLKLQCCGNPLWGKNDALSRDLTLKKLEDGRRAGAHYLCVACTYCQIQFDTVQQQMVAEGLVSPLPSILYPQLLGLSLGLEARVLGLDMNRLQLGAVVDHLS